MFVATQDAGDQDMRSWLLAAHVQDIARWCPVTAEAATGLCGVARAGALPSLGVSKLLSNVMKYVPNNGVSARGVGSDRLGVRLRVRLPRQVPATTRPRATRRAAVAVGCRTPWCRHRAYECRAVGKAVCFRAPLLRKAGVAVRLNFPSRRFVWLEPRAMPTAVTGSATSLRRRTTIRMPSRAPWASSVRCAKLSGPVVESQAEAEAWALGRLKPSAAGDDGRSTPTSCA